MRQRLSQTFHRDRRQRKEGDTSEQPADKLSRAQMLLLHEE